MIRFAAIVLVSSAAAAAAVSSAAAGATPAAPPRAELENLVCQRALDPAARAISVEAVMRPVTGTVHMALRFELLGKAKSARSFSSVRGGDLGKWISPSNPTLGQLPADVWKLDKQVMDLAAPATYRFQVSFRWSGADGRVLQGMQQTSTTCYEPELRPDLQVVAISPQPRTGSSTQETYVAEIRNSGATAAGRFEVEFTDEKVVTFQTIDRLAPHQTRNLNFVGPICDPQSPPTVVVDPNHQVDDSSPANNSLTADCGT